MYHTNMRSALIWLRIDALLKKRFPTLIGLGILVGGLIVGLLLVDQDTVGFLPRASEEHQPQKVRITNITHNSFTISFSTLEPVQSAVEYGIESGDYPQEALDDRNQLTSGTQAYKTHHITVRGLEPATQYYFRIGTGRSKFYDNQGEPFSVRTARQVDTSAASTSLFGKVANQAGNPVDGALVYITTNGASPISSYTKQDGSWSIPLSNVRTQDLSSLFVLEDSHLLRVQVIDPAGQTLDEEVVFAKRDLLNNLQFGQRLTDIADESADSATNQETDQTSQDNEQSTSASPPPDKLGGLLTDDDRFNTYQPGEVTLIYPAEEEEIISTTKPEFSGQAPPGSSVQIEVQSPTTYYGVAQTDDQGKWTWSPPEGLEPGDHTITIRYTDDDGNQVEQSRRFIVQANGATPSFVSTPSGQLVSPSPSPLPSPSLVVSPSPTPRPTPSPSLRPSPSPSPKLVATQSAQPVSSTTGPFWLMAAVSFFFVGMGVVWWLIKPAVSRSQYDEPFA